MPATLEQAYEGAKRRYRPEAWAMLTSAEIRDAVYEEMRRIDVEISRQREQSPPNPETHDRFGRTATVFYFPLKPR
jgi:hypothetical protein